MSKDSDAIKEGLRSMNMQESNSDLEMFLSNNSLGDYWDAILNIQDLETALQGNIASLATTKAQLSDAKTSTEEKKASLAALQKQLTDQKAVLDASRAEQNKLLSETKNKESNYQAMIADKEKAQAQFESELLDYESKLKFALDPSTIPHTGSGVLSWPFSAEYMADCPKYAKILGNSNCVTQNFGDTAFSQTGAYNGKGHNGVDFRAPVGTQLHAVLAGTVQGTGNTDLIKGCYSYGKWVLIRHDNGLTSLYGHLSVISVTTGEHVDTGQVIGYSGQTGYVTGPHLHLGLFVSAAVYITKLTKFTGQVTPCANASMPVSPLNGYLNALNYL
jgi:murein DD-endopeptidase MepM/ murein hydrolase activator NlpD